MNAAFPQGHSGFTLNMNILCNFLQWEKTPLKNVRVSSAWDHYTHHGLHKQKRPFISNCRVDADFLKAIDWKWHSWGTGEEPWMETVDSHFHCSPAVSSIAAWPWRGGRGRPCIWCFSWDLRHRAVTPVCTRAYSFQEVSSQKGRWKQPYFHCILSAYMPQFALIAVTVFLAIWFHLLNKRAFTQA